MAASFNCNISRPGAANPREKEKIMFKKFIERIIAAKDKEEAIATVFYGADGIDMAYQRERITWKEHEMLLAIINKMA